MLFTEEMDGSERPGENWQYTNIAEHRSPFYSHEVHFGTQFPHCNKLKGASSSPFLIYCLHIFYSIICNQIRFLQKSHVNKRTCRLHIYVHQALKYYMTRYLPCYLLRVCKNEQFVRLVCATESYNTELYGLLNRENVGENYMMRSCIK